MSSYQKLKDRIKKLESDLDTIAMNPGSMESITIIIDRRMKREMKHLLWFGTPLTDSMSKYDGILHKINP